MPRPRRALAADGGGAGVQESLFLTDHVGVTALHAAVQSARSEDTARALLEGGADVNARTHKGNTPLLFAANAGHHGAAEMLLAAGAAANAQNAADGDAPLHRAVSAAPARGGASVAGRLTGRGRGQVREGHVSVVRLLLQYGANKALLNKCDMTPVQLADRLRVRSARARARAAAARALTVWPRAHSTVMDALAEDPDPLPSTPARNPATPVRPDAARGSGAGDVARIAA